MLTREKCRGFFSDYSWRSMVCKKWCCREKSRNV